jgi:hypothetical protein
LFAYCDGYANACTLGFYRCHAYANCNADVNDSADVDTRSGESLCHAKTCSGESLCHAKTCSGESLCHAKTCSGEYFYGQRRSSERSCK